VNLSSMRRKGPRAGRKVSKCIDGNHSGDGDGGQLCKKEPLWFKRSLRGTLGGGPKKTGL